MTKNSVDKRKVHLPDMLLADPATGFMKRDAILRESERFLLEEGAHEAHALFLIFIENYKALSDTREQKADDTMLRELSFSICSCLRKTDLIGRVEDGMFLALMKNAPAAELIEEKAREMIRELQYICAERQGLSANIGIAVYHGESQPAKPFSALYEEAGSALARARASGKNSYAFADAPNAETADMGQSASLRSMALNLRGLLNHLGGGVEIYHGTKDGRIIPQFRNRTQLDLIGDMTEREQLDTYAQNPFFGVHPEDVETFKAAFYTSLAQSSQLQHTYRIKGKHGGYRWVTITANFVKYDDGSYDVYAIYTDAEKVMRERKALEDRYSSLQRRRALADKDKVAFFMLNLTADRCDDAAGELFCVEELCQAGTATGVLEGFAAHIDSPDTQTQYRVLFTHENLKGSIWRADRLLRIDFPCRIDASTVRWLRLTAETVENPRTHDIETLLQVFDIDWETRLQLIMQRLIGIDYEFIAQIDVDTGILTVFGGNTDAEVRLMHAAGADYRQCLRKNLRDMIREDYYEEVIEALGLENIIAELEKSSAYTCAFPTKQCGSMKAGFHQWRCCYIDEQKKIIMMSRTDVTDTLGSELDALTGLYKQQGFYRRVREILKANPNKKFHLLRFDVDNFKLLNDTLGFEAGDRMLRDLGAALRRRMSRLGDEVVFARLEADHFVSFRSQDGPSPEMLMREIEKWMKDYPINYTLSSHMGVFRVHDHETDVSAMCDRALLALKKVKRSFSRRIGYYDESMRSKLMGEQEMSSEMGDALVSGQFEVYFQPQYNYESGALIGAEALVRWNHPTKGVIMPSAFIPLFEENGFITKLDEYIWDRSCAYMRRWMDEPDKYAPVPVSVNISRIDIYNSRLPQTLPSILEKHGVPTEMFKLEITETAYMQNPEQLIRTVKELRQEGFTVEMDDFGSGYSSLNMLKDVPVDTLKLDMKFLVHCEDDERAGNILSSVIRMADGLKIPVIAEGVENKHQADYLKSLGCVCMQGYHFARPMPAGEFEKHFAQAAQN